MERGGKRVKVCSAKHPTHLSVRCEKEAGHPGSHRFMWNSAGTMDSLQWAK
jgi:hypothetical protein